MTATNEPATPGLRERNRLALRRKLSDTATQLFLAQGFDAVRVSDVAAACGVSTKTVWNHFPTKEALVLDRGDRLATALGAAARDRTDVLDVVIACIHTELDQLDTRGPRGPADRDRDPIAGIRAFVQLVEGSPGLRAAAADRVEQLVHLAADALAVQTGAPAGSARNQILAGAVVALWRLHLSALLEAGARSLPLPEVQAHVRAEVRAGADLVAQLVQAAAQNPGRD